MPRRENRQNARKVIGDWKTSQFGSGNHTGNQATVPLITNDLAQAQTAHEQENRIKLNPITIS